MIRRNRRYSGVALRNVNPLYPASQTNQREPSLRELLIKYQRGEDISDYITISADKATAEQQFKNRFAKVDPLTEIESYVKQETLKASKMIENDKSKKVVNNNQEDTSLQSTGISVEKSEK